MIVWISGLSGAGKTTIGTIVHRLWRADEPNTVLVDGDVLREVMRMDRLDSDYTLEGRHRVAENLHRLCLWLDSQEINVVCCTISFFNDVRDENRRKFSKYFEVVIDVPLDVLVERDSKNLYKPAMAGEISNVIGVDLPYEWPTSPDLVIDNRAPTADHTATARRIYDGIVAARRSAK